MQSVKFNWLLLFVLLWVVSLNSWSQVEKPKTEFRFGGYLKADFLNTWYTNGDVEPGSFMRDIHLPGLIPIGERDLNHDLDFHVKESRFSFDVRNRIFGKEIRGFVELDFLFSQQGNTRVTNSYSPRLRHFFFEWNNLVIGQTWTTFMILTLPDEIDFTGALEGIVIIRQPLVRYQLGNWWFAIENPETTVNPFQSADLQATETAIFPDVIVRRNFGGQWGNWSIAGIVRGLHSKDSVTHNAIGFGVTTGGRLKMGSRGDDVRMVVTAGNGLGRYVAANFIAGAATNELGGLNPISSLNGYIAYNHFWIPQNLSSSFSASAFQAFHEYAESPTQINSRALSLSGNIKYDPLPVLRFGLEYMYGYREAEDGLSGGFHRVQLAAKYTFGFSNVE